MYIPILQNVELNTGNVFNRYNSLGRLNVFNREILDCYKANLFLVNRNGRVLTPEFKHPMSSAFTVIPTYTRDTLLVNYTQKLHTNIQEQPIPVDSLSLYTEAFLSHDLFGIIPVSSITHESQTYPFSYFSESIKIQHTLDEILQGKIQMKTLCIDRYTEEDWSIIV